MKKFNKTETKLLYKLAFARRDRVTTFGKRENDAARKLDELGLVRFTNTSCRIPAQNSRKRDYMGNYLSSFVTQGHIELI